MGSIFMCEYVRVPLGCAKGKCTGNSRKSIGNATVPRDNQLLASLHVAIHTGQYIIPQ